MALAQRKGCRELGGRPFAGAPVEHFALRNEVVHCADGLQQRGGGVGPVAEIEVEVVHLEAPQRGMTGLDDVLAGQPHFIGAVVLRPEIYLAGNKKAAAPPAGFFQDIAHDHLGLAVGVTLGIVEEVHAGIVGGMQQVAGDRVADLAAEGDPGAKGQRRDLQAGRTEPAVDHGHEPRSMRPPAGMSNAE